MTDDEINIIEEASDVAKTAQEFGKVGALNLLLGPSAKVLGEHWAKNLSAYLSPKEQKNLHNHLEATQNTRKDPKSIEVSPQKVGALIEWTVSAKKINQDETPELALAWQKALVELLQDNYELLSSLTKLDEASLVHFKSGGKIPETSFQSFKNIGLIDTKKAVKFWLFREFGSFIFLILLYIPILYSTIFSNFIISMTLQNFILVLIMSIIYALSGFYIWTILPKIMRGNLTHKGRYLYVSLCGSSHSPEYFSTV